MVKIGEKIPNFTLEAYHNDKIKKITLLSHKGKWLILLFYPGDFTFICPTELEEAARLYKEFKKLGAEILSVSTDSVHVHKAWHDTSSAIKKVRFPMLADPTGTLSRAFGTYIENGNDAGRSLRGTFVIDPDCVLRAFEIHDNTIGRNIEELLRKLQACVYVREHNGEVCPVGWRPGAKTLKPGLHLVGKI